MRCPKDFSFLELEHLLSKGRLFFIIHSFILNYMRHDMMPRIWYYKGENIVAIFEDENMLDIEMIRQILYPIFQEYNVKKAVLFGSYAKGLANERSDVDICVDSGLRGLRFFGLLEDVTEALNKNVDLIDTSQIVQDSRVEKEIDNTGVLIYGK